MPCLCWDVLFQSWLWASSHPPLLGSLWPCGLGCLHLHMLFLKESRIGLWVAAQGARSCCLTRESWDRYELCSVHTVTEFLNFTVRCVCFAFYLCWFESLDCGQIYGWVDENSPFLFSLIERKMTNNILVSFLFPVSLYFEVDSLMMKVIFIFIFFWCSMKVNFNLLLSCKITVKKSILPSS